MALTSGSPFASKNRATEITHAFEIETIVCKKNRTNKKHVHNKPTYYEKISNDGATRETICGTYTKYSFKSINAFGCIFAINAIGCILVANGMLSIACINSIGSFLSINSMFSLFSVNCIFCIGCHESFMCVCGNFPDT